MTTNRNEGKAKYPEGKTGLENKFNEAVPVMHDEVTSFFSKYLSKIDGEEFWQACVKEFPPLSNIFLIDNEHLVKPLLSIHP